MGFGQWKPQQASIQSEAFYVDQRISFMYRKKSLLVNLFSYILVYYYLSLFF